MHGEGNIRGSALDTVNVVDSTGDIDNAYERMDKRQGTSLYTNPKKGKKLPLPFFFFFVCCVKVGVSGSHFLCS